MKCRDHVLSRRNLLTVGAIGGIGLTLTDFFKLKQARADQKHYESKEGTAKSVIFVFLPVEWRNRNRSILSHTLRWSTVGHWVRLKQVFPGSASDSCLPTRPRSPTRFQSSVR